MNYLILINSLENKNNDYFFYILLKAENYNGLNFKFTKLQIFY